MLGVLVILALAALGAAVLAWGTGVRASERGRRVCGACRFDVAGLGESGRCPECGAELGAAGAVGFVWERRRRRAVRLGVGLVLGSFVLGGLALALPFLNVTLVGLPFPAAPGAPAARAAVDGGRFARLTARLPAMGEAELRTVVAEVIARQADLATPWPAEAGDLMEAAREAGRLTPAEWSAYCRGATAGTSYAVFARDDGGALLRVERPRARAGRTGVAVRMRVEGVWVDGEEVPGAESAGTFSYDANAGGRPSGTFARLPGAGWGRAQRARVRLGYEEVGMGATAATPGSDAAWTEEVELPVRPTPLGVDERALSSAFGEPVRVGLTPVGRMVDGVRATIVARGVDDPLEVEVTLRWRVGDERREVSLGTMGMPGGGGGFSMPLEGQAAGLVRGAEAEVVLRPGMAMPPAPFSERRPPRWVGEVVVPAPWDGAR